MFKRFAIGLAALIVVGFAGFTAFAWRPVIAPVAVPPSSQFTAELVGKGEVLAAAGNCASCHSAVGGKSFAGGYAIKTGFGTIYSSNITPDAKTGIGTWTEAAFSRAMRQGVAANGSQLYPAFPYDHFTKLSDGDVSALYAYVMTRPPVDAVVPANELSFPFNIRALQAGWKLLFFESGPLESQPMHDTDWNRGAYLAEGIAHCGACHTPRNIVGAEINSKAYAGGLLDGRSVPALTKANFSPVPWSQDELFAYLRTGTSTYHGRAGGPMAGVVRDGLSKLPDADIKALSVYFADIGDTTSRIDEMKVAIKRAQSADALDLTRQDDDARLYRSACGSCHYNDGKVSAANRPDLALVADINAPDPDRVIKTVLFGRGSEMPAFGIGLKDADVAHVLAYLRASRTASPPWTDLESRVAKVRAADMTKASK